MTKEELIALSLGNCVVKRTDVAQAVIINNPQNGDASLCASPTESVIIDANKISQSVCPTVFMPLTNNSGGTRIVKLGAFGGAGNGFLNNDTRLFAADSPGVTSDDYAAALSANAPSAQRFAFITRTMGVIAKRVIVRLGTAPVAGQSSQNLVLKNYSIDVNTNCNGQRVNPACNTCFSNGEGDEIVKTFEGPFVFDDLHSAEYSLLNTQAATIEIELDAQASARGYVPCVANAS